MQFTHIDQSNMPTMVDVSEKKVSKRTAHARAIVRLPKELKEKFVDGEFMTAKGPVLQTAIIAGTMAVKKTADLIPFCHPLPLDSIKFKIDFAEEKIEVNCLVACHARTGVEMEALTGANLAALTIYDMCKGVSKAITIEETKLIKKTGGKTDYVS